MSCEIKNEIKKQLIIQLFFDLTTGRNENAL